ncbi:hypothetical protein ACWDTR_33540 [Streptomyces sp. NPDC003470]|uniref:hypothetical protein n=1 Tax=Streptomyces sp. NPDC127100 TaxID=3347138 RepID=UPI00364785A3
MAGISTLFFTGVATYYGAKVSQDQLAQSRDDAERGALAQARLISWWEDRNRDSSLRAVHVMNRSPDPVYNLFIKFVLSRSEHRWYPVVLFQASIAPCTVVTIRPEDVTWRSDPKGETQSAAEHPLLGIYELEFWDSGGQLWSRGQDGIPERGSSALDAPKASIYAQETSPLSTKRAEPCGGDSR